MLVILVILNLAARALDGQSVSSQRPTGLTPATNLSAEQRRQNFEALWTLLDAQYADFRLKSIDWNAVGDRYRARLATVGGDDDFYALMFQLVNELKDTHSWLDNYRAPPLADVPELPLDLFNENIFVVAGARAGWQVVTVDGMTPLKKMEALRPFLRACSSERAFRRQAARSLLAGSQAEPVTIELRSPEGRVETLTFRRSGRRVRPPAPAVAGELTRQRFVHFGRLRSGVGYIQIVSFDGREEIADEFDRALESLRDTPGLVLDIRDNQGGFGQSRIAGRFLTKRTLAGFSYIRNGRRHGDFTKREIYVEPSGPWRYTRPVVLLVNDVTGSAADLFAMEVRSAPTVTTVGSTTHGNLSGVAVYGVLPCGLVVRISNGYIADAKDRPIEGRGNVPDVAVEPDVQDYLNARDPVLERAAVVIAERTAAARPR